jgi:AraC family transcriptional regulator, transcriptional activator of the genes for pyochelin and ferripyochelin receptors
VCPAALGVGAKQWLSLRDIDLLIHDYEFHQDIEVLHSPTQEGLEIGFQLQGGSYAQRCAGHSFVQNGPTPLRNSFRRSGERTLQVDLHIRSVDHFHCILHGRWEEACLEIRRLFHDSDQEPYAQIDTTTPAMHNALEQLLHCPFQGLTRQIYMEGKCWELIALKLDQLAAESPSITPKQLNRDDIDRIHEAKAILTRSWQTPPSLLELAWQVGLNDYKLKLGFRQR